MIWKSDVFCYIDNLNKMAWFKYKITDKVLELVYTFDTVLGWNQIKLFIQNIFIEINLSRFRDNNSYNCLWSTRASTTLNNIETRFNALICTLGFAK